MIYGLANQANPRFRVQYPANRRRAHAKGGRQKFHAHADRQDAPPDCQHDNDDRSNYVPFAAVSGRHNASLALLGRLKNGALRA